MKARFLYGDFAIWVIFILLASLSLIEVYSAGSFLAIKEGSYVSPFFRQFSYLLLSGVGAYIFHNIPWKYYKLIPPVGVPAMFLLLGLVLLSGQNLNNGARWLSFMGVSFQPSELAKLVLIITVSLILATSQTERGASKRAYWWVVVLSGAVMLLIVTQNLSTALLIGLVILLMLIIARVPWKPLLLTLAVVVGLGGAFVGFLKVLPEDPHHEFYDGTYTQRLPTWRARLFNETMVVTPDPHDFEVTDKNRQVVHARIAMARAKGVGLAPGRSIQRDYLSAAYSDFIFAIIGEEMGILGVIGVVFCYLVLLVRAGIIASRCQHNFPAFLVLGLALMLVTQAMVNMFVAVGIGPVTGQTLPLVSKGGSSTVITGVYFGMMLSVSRYARRKGEATPELTQAETEATKKAFAQT